MRSANPQGEGRYSDVFIHTSDPVFIGSEYIRRVGSFFGGSKFLISIFFGFSENEYFLDDVFVDIFFFLGGGSSQN